MRACNGSCGINYVASYKRIYITVEDLDSTYLYAKSHICLKMYTKWHPTQPEIPVKLVVPPCDPYISLDIYTCFANVYIHVYLYIGTGCIPCLYEFISSAKHYPGLYGPIMNSAICTEYSMYTLCMPLLCIYMYVYSKNIFLPSHHSITISIGQVVMETFQRSKSCL